MTARTRSRHPHRARRVVAAALVVAAAAVGLGACGIPLDEEPRPIAQTTIPPTEATPTTLAEDGGQEVAVYFLHGDGLERQDYPVDAEPTLEQALGFVLEPPPEGSDDLSSSVPPGTTLRGVEVRDGIAAVDLSGEINDVTNQAQKEAFAQVVFTTLAFPGVDAVRFLVDGEAIDAPTDQGNRSVVRAGDYDPPLNPR